MSDITGSYGWIRSEAEAQITASAPFGVYVWVKDVFPDSLVAEVERDTPLGMSSVLASYTYSVEGSILSLGEPEAVELDYVAVKRREIAEKAIEEEQAGRGAELGGPLAIKDASKRLVTGAVLVPGEVDGKGEPPLSPERIEQAAHEWMRDWRYSDREHDFGPPVAVPVESYILPDDVAVKMAGEDVVLPGGSWVVTSYVTDDQAWKDVQSGDLTGYSIAGIKREALEAATKSGETVAFKSRTLLSDLGDDWISGAVSLVGNPAVAKGTWFAIKSHTESVRANERGESREVGGFWSRLLGLKSAQPKQEDDATEEDSGMADFTDGQIQKMEKMIADGASGAVTAALKDAGVIKDEPSDTDRILEAVNGLGERVQKLEGGEVAQKTGEGSEGNAQGGVWLTDEQAEAITPLLRKFAAKSNGAGRGAPKEADQATVAVKSTEDIDDGRDVYGRSTKKVYS